MFQIHQLINDQYEVLQQRQGGMGYVYFVYDQVTRQRYVIKMIKDNLESSKLVNERFENEARAWINLGAHPHIVRALSFQRKPVPFLLEEFIDGPNLHELISKQPGGMSFRQAVTFAIHIARGLEHAHSLQLVIDAKDPAKTPRNHQEIGIIHRDLKPHNILINAKCQAKIADFGLAKVIGESSYGSSHHIVGTLPYMAKEQVEGRKITKHTDIYALGVTLYEMITGHRPFPDGSYQELSNQIKKFAPIPITKTRSNVPSLLSDFVYECLSKQPQQRPRSARHVLNKLNEIAAQLPDEPTISCSHCGFITLNKESSCPVCEYKAEAKIVLPPDDAPTLWRCACGSDLSLTFSCCIECGARRCPKKTCQSINHQKYLYCLDCGHLLKKSAISVH